MSRHRYTAQGGSRLCTRLHVAEKIDDRALQQSATQLTPICSCSSVTIVKCESISGLEHGLMIVLSNKGATQLTNLLLLLGHDREVRIYQWARARIGCPADEDPFFPFPRVLSLPALT